MEKKILHFFSFPTPIIIKFLEARKVYCIVEEKKKGTFHLEDLV